MLTLTLEQLRASTLTGGVAGVTLKAQGGAFVVRINTQSGEAALLTKARSTEPRTFGNPVRALKFLLELGLVSGAFDLKDWNPDAVARKKRPDRADALRHTYAAADHAKWFAEQVRLGIAEADAPDAQWVTHETAKENFQQQRKALKKRIAGKH